MPSCCGGRLPGGGELYPHPEAPSAHPLGTDLAAVELDDGRDQREAEPWSTLSPPSRIRPEKVLEKVGQQLGRHSGTVVLDRQVDGVVARLDGDVHPCAGRRMALRIVEELVECEAEQARVADER
jgi:hypothetical protein